MKENEAVISGHADLNPAITAEQIKDALTVIHRIQIHNVEYISEEEAAQYLKLEPRTLRLWRTHRGLPHFKPTSKVILFRRKDLDEWVVS